MKGSTEKQSYVAEYADLLLKGRLWGARFGAPLESLFTKHSSAISAHRNRLFVLCAAVAIMVFAFIDPLAGPSVDTLSKILRLGVIVPMLLLLLICTFFSRFQDVQHPLLMLTCLVIAVINILIMRLSDEPGAMHYHGLLMLTFVFGNLLLRVPFWYAMGWTVPVFVLYAVFYNVLQFGSHPAVLMYYSILVFVVGVASLIANYEADIQTRRDYLRQIVLTHEKEKSERARQEFYRVSVVDGLTDLYNRRHFDEALAQAWRNAYEEKAPISLLFIDVDCFKLYNDNYGHQKGDQCLRLLANILQTLKRRPGDIVARYGGEEFVVLLPGMRGEGALEFAEKIRKKVSGLKLAHLASTVSHYVTVSIGVSNIVPQPGMDARILVERADQALYRAKESGRNRVMITTGNALHLVSDRTPGK